MKIMLMKISKRAISGDRNRAHRRFKWLYALIAGGIVALLVTAMIYDALSGLDPNTVTKTSVVESLYSSSGYAGGTNMYLIVRFDNGEKISPYVSETTIPRIGRSILVSEKSSLAFRNKHRSFARYLD